MSDSEEFHDLIDSIQFYYNRVTLMSGGSEADDIIADYDVLLDKAHDLVSFIEG